MAVTAADEATASTRLLRRRWWAVLVLSLLAGVSTLFVPLAPVVQHTATYHWRGADGEVALPLNPYRPERLTLGWECAAIGPEAGPVLTTVRATDEGLLANRLDLAVGGGEVRLITRGVTMALAGAYPCGRAQVVFDGSGVRLFRDGVEVAHRAGDLRPVMDGLSGPGLGAVTAEVVADTQWDSSPTVLKQVLIGLTVVLLLAAVVLAVLTDRPRRAVRRTRWVGGGSVGGEWWRRHWDDVALVPVMVFGVIAGGATDDDGFIAQILGTRTTSGYLGNYVRWNNAPEAPFGWFYELYSRWGVISMEPVWLRLLPALLAAFGWVVLRHALLPRLLGRSLLGRSGGALWPRLALLAGFSGFWLVFCNSLRPEIWFGVGLGVVMWCVLDALHRRRAWPLLVGGLVAGLTVGTGPTGLVALAPFVLLLRPLWRWLGRDRVRAAALGVCWLACVGAVGLLAFADQSLAAVVSATDARNAFGPTFPFWQDPIRYWRLYMSFAARQWTVYLAGVALLLLGVRLIRWRGRGLLPGLNRRVVWLVVGSALGLVVAMAMSPTKLPHHFGALVLIGPLAMAGVTHLLQRHRGRAWAGVLVGASIAVFGVSLHGNNTWWKLSTLGLVADRDLPPVAGVSIASWLVGLGIVIGVLVWAVPLLARSRAGGRLRTRGRTAAAYALALTLLTGSQYANFAVAAVKRGPERYTMASAALSAMSGEGCKLTRSLAYEPDPVAGLLPVAEGPNLFTDGPVWGIPTWQSHNDRVAMTSGWYALSDSVRSGQWPVVIGVSGIDAGHRVRVEFDRGGARQLIAEGKTIGINGLVDERVLPPKAATRFRVVLESDGPSAADAPFVIGAPRVPVTRPLMELAQSERIAVAWNLAFFAPCLTAPVEWRGTVEIADYILSDSVQPGNTSYNSRTGGPFAGVLGLTTANRVPLYAPHDYEEWEMEGLDLIRLDPRYGKPPPAAVMGSRVRSGWDPVPTVP
ncbi:hypothetical protein CGZ93_12960 [Enemella dayhoffiae]|uniref:Arabinofuranosyltransferase central domain-containing protein n=1 Tax=Enemella dayhoffiae TaxID=2016507 RepID=A0A255GUE0_9ACTN|nr:arabinosyltransferase domain-containing protein [Enemella dayhoffiae]OYO19288.1 hypothetical protein CGZ93_12960 [Enemella dayhoffiae]